MVENNYNYCLSSTGKHKMVLPLAKANELVDVAAAVDVVAVVVATRDWGHNKQTQDTQKISPQLESRV